MKKFDFSFTAFLCGMTFAISHLLSGYRYVVDIMPLAMYVVMLILGVIVYVVSLAFAHDLKGCNIGMASSLLTWSGMYVLVLHQGLGYGLFICGTLLCFGYCGCLISHKFLKRL